MILSWTDELMRAYDILNSTNDRNLLPLCHSTQNAQITIDINSDGNIPSIGFAEKVEKEDRQESGSAGRNGGYGSEETRQAEERYGGKDCRKRKICQENQRNCGRCKG